MPPTFDINKLVRPNILALKPYRSARDDFKSGVLLDANENPYPQKQGALNRYPDPHQEALRSAIAAYRGTDPERVFTGNGSDEAIDLLIRIFCRPGIDKIAITPPTYGMYKVSADIQDVEVLDAPLLPDFSLDPDALLQKAGDAKIIFLCSPNNPTANALDRDAILKTIRNFHGIVVVDEAYIDFSGSASFIDTLDGHPNLVVLQTLSKAFGLAGIRLGMAFASREIISLMMKVKPPYNVNSLTQEMAIGAFRDLPGIEQKIAQILQQRSYMAGRLAEIPFVERIFPSDANFLLVKMRDALNIYGKLARSGVVVRYRGDQPHCADCLRITIGTEEENEKLLESLRNITI